MRFLLDESADLPLADYLRAKGHDVTTIVEDYTHSIKDTEVLSIAVSEQRILITNDKDFGELVFHRSLPHRGIILFRLEEEPISLKEQWLDRVLRQYKEVADFLVITERGIRRRSSRRPPWSSGGPRMGAGSAAGSR